LSDPTMLSDSIVYFPYLEELLNFSNPDIVVATSVANPRVRNPRVRNDTIINPRVRNTAVGSWPQGEVTDLRWTVTNDGNTTSAYSFEPIGETPSVEYQLLIHRVTTTPVSAQQCLLEWEEHHELLLSIENPRVRNPRVRNPRVRNPRVRNNTFFLAPEEIAVITLRLIDPEPDSEQEGLLQSTQSSSGSGTSNGSFDPDFYAKTVAGAAIPQGANPDGEIYMANFMWIYTTTPYLPDGLVSVPYVDTLLEAEEGVEPYTWDLVLGYGDLPQGLNIVSNETGTIWTISGKPSYDPPYDEYDELNEVAYKTYNFVVQATDSTPSTPQTAYRSLSIKIISPNQAPVAADDDTPTTAEDTPVTIDVLANDSDVDGDTLSISSVTQGANGAVATDGTSVTYSPVLNFYGTDSFTYTVSDGNGGSDTATVTVIVSAVSDAPVAVNDNYTLIKGPPRRGRRDYILEVSTEDGVLANDTDADGDSLTAIMVTRPIRGGMTFRSDGSFRYRLNDEFVGTVSFTYQVSDGNGGTDTATVTIIVEN